MANDVDLTYVMEAPVKEPSPTNRRVEPRHRPEAVREITAIRLSPGDSGLLINISASGLLMESHTRYAPGGAVTVHFEGTIEPRQIKGRIVRCQVSAIGEKGVLHYQTAVTFKGRLRLAVDESHPPARPADEPGLSDVGASPTEEPDHPDETLNRW